ncbi:MAG: hypothetical protein COU69_02785 [Candidatus Pacebacteria bacterium CG10_big_fil_rev_8_21_14_0_10_56_10]|nr:MAG: hypothetical protein COU69_02785 [Candidatus Pacebacteria bacterium CG10_big_fil_rev_8_21_14_0_10_56_10]
MTLVKIDTERDSYDTIAVVAEDEFQSEVDRIKAFGARVVKEQYHPSEEQEMWIAAFADLDDNCFQITPGDKVFEVGIRYSGAGTPAYSATACSASTRPWP